MDIKTLNMHDNPLSDKIVSLGSTSFKLWLEFEETTPWDDVTNDFANVIVDTLDGRSYAINIWTFKFHQTALKHEANEGNEQYLIPPDLFVNELTRPRIEQVISNLLDVGPLESVLNPSVFGLKFIEPYWSRWDMEDDMIEGLTNELHREMPNDHPLKDQTFQLLARDQRNDDIILELDDESIAVIHLTWKQSQEFSGFPLTRMYPSPQAFWEAEMREVIKEYRNTE